MATGSLILINLFYALFLALFKLLQVAFRFQPHCFCS